MIEEQRLVTYLNSLEQPESPLLAELRREALADGVPIIRSETAALLRFLVHVRRPKEILEVGTAIGYSALVMAETAADAHITTMEKYEKRIPQARANFARAGREEQITFLAGDATELLAALTGPFDLIFMDAAKAQYIIWLPQLLRLSAPGTLIISDNVLQNGDVLESRFAVTRRNRTIHKRMRDYLYTLKHTEGLASVVLPVGDGIALTQADHPAEALRCLEQKGLQE